MKLQIKSKILFWCWLFCGVAGVYAQQPFVTDDADVTEKGKFHIEASNEIDRLPDSSLPVKYQNEARVTLDYGLVKNVEVSVSAPVLSLVNQRSEDPRFVTGLGDMTLSVKYNFWSEHADSRLPALAVNVYFQVPTGDASRSLGSGVTDFGFYGIAQKTYKEKNEFRLNLGYVASGNTLSGVLGISSVRGQVFTGSASYVRKINKKLQLGAELTGAVTSNFQISKGQLQTQFGGNYQINEKTTFDFGLIVGRFAASPRFGFQFGFSHDF